MDSSSEKSKILVIGGTGYIGKFIVEASVKCGHKTFALVRESTAGPTHPSKPQALDHFRSLGVNLLSGDIYDHRSLVNAMKQVDVVIAAIGHRSSAPIQDQIKILAAIKEAGNIKRFIPSEFGLDVDRVHAVKPAKSVFEMKAKFRETLKEEGVPFTIVCANYFARTCLPAFEVPLFEANPKDRLLILGDGNVKGVFNLEEDIGTYTIRAVADPRTLNKILYIRPPSNIYSFNDIVLLWETKIGHSIERIYFNEQQILDYIQETTDNLTKMILAVGYSSFVKGDHTNYEIEPAFGVEAAALYPDVNYTTVEQFLNSFV